jgi:hypothetical protein
MRNARQPAIPHVVIGIMLFAAAIMAALAWSLNVMMKHAEIARAIRMGLTP